MIDEKEKMKPYMVGGLLYTPAITADIAEKIKNHAYPNLMSMAFCLEDSIQDDVLEQAQIKLKQTLETIKAQKSEKEKLPLFFIRIRTPEHMKRVHDLLGETEEILTGYILPKFDLTNAEVYMSLIEKLNQGRKQRLSIMPILESKMIADIKNRTKVLLEIKEILDASKKYVLNVRVGGNDFSNLYGLRRSVAQSIYEIGVIRDILMDIINVFVSDYVVSGPVWEYFGNDLNGAWAAGLKRELELDRLNGFLGKTSIHPTQLPLIYESMKVDRADYEDAMSILHWSSDELAVEKSPDGTRMNEVKCHTKWAVRIAILGQIYGIRKEGLDADMVESLV